MGGSAAFGRWDIEADRADDLLGVGPVDRREPGGRQGEFVGGEQFVGHGCGGAAKHLFQHDLNVGQFLICYIVGDDESAASVGKGNAVALRKSLIQLFGTEYPAGPYPIVIHKAEKDDPAFIFAELVMGVELIGLAGFAAQVLEGLSLPAAVFLVELVVLVFCDIPHGPGSFRTKYPGQQKIGDRKRLMG